MERRRDERKSWDLYEVFSLRIMIYLPLGLWSLSSTALSILVAHIGGTDPSKQLSHGTLGFP